MLVKGEERGWFNSAQLNTPTLTLMVEVFAT